MHSAEVLRERGREMASEKPETGSRQPKGLDVQEDVPSRHKMRGRPITPPCAAAVNERCTQATPKLDFGQVCRTCT